MVYTTYFMQNLKENILQLYCVPLNFKCCSNYLLLLEKVLYFLPLQYRDLHPDMLCLRTLSEKLALKPASPNQKEAFK